MSRSNGRPRGLQMLAPSLVSGDLETPRAASTPANASSDSVWTPRTLGQASSALPTPSSAAKEAKTAGVSLGLQPDIGSVVTPRTRTLIDDGGEMLPPVKKAKPSLCRLGLIGAGIFASESYASALLKERLQEVFEVKAVYSRSQEKAEKLAARFANATSYHGDTSGCEELLARTDIDAVCIALPIGMLPDFVRLALLAGKHVMSEKPIAPDLASGRSLLAEYEAQHLPKGLIWRVAENYRYEGAFVRAAELVACGQVGRPTGGRLAACAVMAEDNKYALTTWRKTPSYGGAMLLDGGIHYVAALRHVLGSDYGSSVQSVSAHVCAHSEHLPPPDTCAATIRFRNGILANVFISFASHGPRFELDVTGDAGTVAIRRGARYRDGRHGYEVIMTGSSSPITPASAAETGKGVESNVARAGAGTGAGAGASASAGTASGAASETVSPAAAPSSGGSSGGRGGKKAADPTVGAGQGGTRSGGNGPNGGAEFYPFGGVDAELEAFGQVVAQALGRASERVVDSNTPEAALSDLEVLSAILESGKKDGAPVVLSS